MGQPRRPRRGHHRRGQRHRPRARAALRARGREGRRQRPRRRARRRGRDAGAAAEGRRRDRAAGGEAVANADDVADWEGAPAADRRRRSTRSAGSTCSSTTPASCATRCSPNMTEDEWDAVIKVHLKGHFCRRATPPPTGASGRRRASRSRRR